MSEIKPELKLTYLEGTNPKHYALNVKMDQQEVFPHLMISHEGDMKSPNSTYEVVVKMGEAAEGTSELDIDLGPLTFDNEESEVTILLELNGTPVGKGTIKVKEAQQESRPIPGNF